MHFVIGEFARKFAEKLVSDVDTLAYISAIEKDPNHVLFDCIEQLENEETHGVIKVITELLESHMKTERMSSSNGKTDLGILRIKALLHDVAKRTKTIVIYRVGSNKDLRAETDEPILKNQPIIVEVVKPALKDNSKLAALPTSSTEAAKNLAPLPSTLTAEKPAKSKPSTSVSSPCDNMPVLDLTAEYHINSKYLSAMNVETLDLSASSSSDDDDDDDDDDDNDDDGCGSTAGNTKKRQREDDNDVSSMLSPSKKRINVSNDNDEIDLMALGKKIYKKAHQNVSNNKMKTHAGNTATTAIKNGNQEIVAIDEHETVRETLNKNKVDTDDLMKIYHDLHDMGWSMIANY